ncbi:MAG: fumarate hydratase [Rhodospirillaceae bacterium]|nr:fumarate hydratase [Rhodospirillaceae bacterium]
MASDSFHNIFSTADDATEYRLLTSDYVSTIKADGRTFLKVDPAGLSELASVAMRDTSHLLRPSHLQQLRNILDDGEASDNDRFVAMEMLKNACVSAGGVLPMCQDTGTAIVYGKKGEQVLTGGNDEAALSDGIKRAYAENNLRYSQMAALDMFTEVGTGNNLPAQIDIYATSGDEFKFMFMAKGGGSANKTFLFQRTKALLNPKSLMEFLQTELPKIGTAACPPYHLAVVIGGLSAEMTLKTVKLASSRYLDGLPTSGDEYGRAFRDLKTEADVLAMTQGFGIGAQFGGKYFCHDVRVVRLPRHGASCPVGIGVSCSADRQILAKATMDGLFLERLETDPAKYLPEVKDGHLSETVVKIDLSKPMDKIRAELSKYPIKTRLSLTGTLIVARDMAHAKLKELMDAGTPLPQYFKDHAIYYAGPAKTPDGMASGSFGPTTAGRMDAYVEEFQAAGGSMVMLAKGNRSAQVREACKKYGGFYLGSIGGVAAELAQKSIKKIECIEFPEMGMEAIWKIEIEDFPAFIVMDDKGNDFFADFKM